MKRINFGKLMRILTCCMLAMAMLAPVEMDAAKKKKRTRTTATATTYKKKKKKRSTSRSQQRSQQTVTEATQQAARNASQRRGGSQKSESGKLKITVDKPDLELIRETTLDPSSKMYFPNLMAKYLKNDTTMTPEEYRYLYLGYMFQEDYDPYRTSQYNDSTARYRERDDLSKAERDTVIKYATLALEDNPFDLGQMSFLIHTLKNHKKDMRAKIWEYRLENLLAAIKSTGTGEDEENAWYVIYPMHEYNMVQLLGYEAVDYEYIDPGYDHLLVQPDGTVSYRKPAEGFYFNVEVPQQQYTLKYPSSE